MAPGLPVAPVQPVLELNRIPSGMRVINHEKKPSSSQSTFSNDLIVADLKGKNA